MQEEPMAATDTPIRLALVDDHRMLLGALTEWIRQAADDIDMVAAVATWPEGRTHDLGHGTSRSIVGKV